MIQLSNSSLVTKQRQIVLLALALTGVMRMNHMDPSYGPYQIFKLNNFSDHATISSDSDVYDDDSDHPFGNDKYCLSIIHSGIIMLKQLA